ASRAAVQKSPTLGPHYRESVSRRRRYHRPLRMDLLRPDRPTPHHHRHAPEVELGPQLLVSLHAPEHDGSGRGGGSVRHRLSLDGLGKATSGSRTLPNIAPRRERL